MISNTERIIDITASAHLDMMRRELMMPCADRNMGCYFQGSANALAQIHESPATLGAKNEISFLRTYGSRHNIFRG